MICYSTILNNGTKYFKELGQRSKRYAV